MSLIKPVTFDTTTTDISVVAPPSPVTRSLFTPTPQQAAFFSALTDTRSHIEFTARAGTGKSTSIYHGLVHYLDRFPSDEISVCAYNKPVQEEMDARLKTAGYDWRQAQAVTVHSMGKSLLKFTFRPEVDEKKTYNILNEIIEAEPTTSPYRAYASTIVQLVSLAKQAAVGFFPHLHPGDRSVWYSLIDHYGIGDFSSDSLDLDAIVTCAQNIYRIGLDITQYIDFDDMILFPLIKSLRVKFHRDIIFVDEEQDLSPARQALIKMFVRPKTGRLVLVGDPEQAIYGWSGADANAMENLGRELEESELGLIRLSLSVTWRCAKSIVKAAQQIVPDLQAADSAPDGEVLRQSDIHTRGEAEKVYSPKPVPTGYICLEDLIPADHGHGDALLCRNTAPLVPLAYRIIRAGVPAKVEGRKIGEGLVELIKRWKVTTTNALRNKLLDFQEREIGKWKAKGKDDKAAEVEDRVGTILHILAEVERRGRHDVQSVVEFIDRLFGDNVKGAVVLATYHRFKGREADRVFLIEHASRCPSRAARQEWQKKQEMNVAYVALTRARQTLVFVG